MKPNTYYRRPDRLVGEVDPRGRFSHPVYNQLMAETWFYHQRLQDAAEEIRELPALERTAKALYLVSLRWGVSGVQLMKQLRGAL